MESGVSKLEQRSQHLEDALLLPASASLPPRMAAWASSSSSAVQAPSQQQLQSAAAPPASTVNLASPACGGATVAAHSPLATAQQPWALRLRQAAHTLASRGSGAAFLHPLADALVLTARMQAAGRCLVLAAPSDDGAAAGASLPFMTIRLPGLAAIRSITLHHPSSPRPQAAAPISVAVLLLNSTATASTGAGPGGGVLVGSVQVDGVGAGHSVLRLAEAVTADSVHLKVAVPGSREGGGGSLCMPRVSVLGQPLVEGGLC